VDWEMYYTRVVDDNPALCGDASSCDV